MKRLSILLAVVIVSMVLKSCAVGKTRTVNSPPPMSSDVMNTHDKNTNFIKANEWMVENFNNALSVIQFTDKEAGIIKGKYLMKAGYNRAAAPYVAAISTKDFYAVITLRVRDNKSRIEIDLTDSTYQITEYAGTSYEPTPQELSATGNRLMADFASHMKGASQNNKW